METKKAQSSQTEQEKKRIEIIRYLKEGRGRQKDAAALFNVSPSCVCYIWKRFLEYGWEAAYSKKRGLKEGKKLKAYFENEVFSMVFDNTPDELKFKSMLWSSFVVKDLIRKKFDIHLSRWQVDRYLSKWQLFPRLSDPERVKKNYGKQEQKWLDIVLPTLKSRAINEQAKILWIERSVLYAQNAAKNGTKSNLELVNNQEILFAVDNRRHCKFFPAKIYGETSIIEFVSRLKKEEKRKLFLIVQTENLGKGNIEILQNAFKNHQVEIFRFPEIS